MDPTEGEEAWFHRLSEQHPFPLRWLGLTWLSARLAQHPEVQRYYLSDERDAVLSLLREQDALAADASDADAVLARLDGVAQRLRDLDPHVVIETSTLPLHDLLDQHPNAVMFSQRGTAIGPVTLVVLPRYAGAARDSQLSRLKVRLRIPHSSEGREAAKAWEAIHDWGEPGSVGPDHVEVVDEEAPAGPGAAAGEGRAAVPDAPAGRRRQAGQARVPKGQPRHGVAACPGVAPRFRRCRRVARRRGPQRDASLQRPPRVAQGIRDA